MAELFFIFIINSIQECIMDTQNPNWVTQFLMDYMFEENQMFEVAVYDKDTDDMRDLSKHQLCGTARFSLGSVMCARGQTCNLSLAGGLASNNERVIIRAETVASNRDTFSCSFAGSKLANKDGFFGKSDPFYVISRIREDGSYQAVYQSDKIMDNLSPTWQQMTISLQALCNCDIDRPLKVEIFDWDSDGKHDTMGSVTTSVRQLLESRGASMDVIEEDKKKKSKGYVNSGTLQCLNAGIKSHPAFLDFLKGGCEISLSVAIDFTGSNGNPSNPTSLHYIHRDGSSFNQYESAIMAVGSVLEPYDSDRKYPVYGFGAQISNGAGGFGPVEHCFPVYSGGYEIDGIAGILQAYHECIGRVHLSGPTLFSPLISYNLEMIKAKGGCSQAKQWYNVLLIISDGIINDMENTISNIVDGSDLPLSIIVIGVGNADFSGKYSFQSIP